MSQANPNKLKLMVVDDESDNLDLLYRTFRRDFRVFKADGALSALGTLETEGEMAVILSDQRMPMMNGTEFLGKTVEQFPDTIRILLTAYTDVEDLVEAINAGQVFKYITKPWNPENLKVVVQQAADTYKVLKQRTNELRRALRREELFNVVTSAIRESLDYQSMLQRIVRTIGENFEASWGILRPVEEEQLIPDACFYQAKNEAEVNAFPPKAEALMQIVLDSRQTQLIEDDTRGTVQLAVPLICQQQTIAVLFLDQIGSSKPWTELDVKLLEAVAAQAALAISQAKLYQRTQQQAE